MSYHGLLPHRVDVMRSDTTVIDGTKVYGWPVVARSVRCRLDLQYIRMGKDPQWTPEAGRPEDRTGVVFFERGVNVRTGDRIAVRVGPSGTFLLEGSIDEIPGRKGKVHHLEVGCKEVPGPLARASAAG